MDDFVTHLQDITVHEMAAKGTIYLYLLESLLLTEKVGFFLVFGPDEVHTMKEKNTRIFNSLQF